MYLNAELVELLCNRVSDSAAYAAAYNCYLFEPLCLCGSAQRAYEVLKSVALVKVIEFFCCSAYYLENDSYRTAAAVEISYSERDTLAVSVCS